jgi:metallophosphoesterase (TIGR00282 family)
MNILYIGDIMGEVGIEVVESMLSKLRQTHQLDLVIAQAENVSGGKGILVSDYRRLKDAGVDFFTGGNWTMHRDEIKPYLSDPAEPIVRPANYPEGTDGLGYKYINKAGKTTLVISLLGGIVGKDADQPKDNPLKVVDSILKANHKKVDATVVNFHGDYSSEKVIIGHYLDGQVSLVVGDHWHVPTADGRVLKKGTAHISDVGMCGALDASLGVSLDSVLSRWRDSKPAPNVLETKGPKQFNAVLASINTKGLADSVSLIQKYLD